MAGQLPLFPGLLHTKLSLSILGDLTDLRAVIIAMALAFLVTMVVLEVCKAGCAGEIGDWEWVRVTSRVRV